MLFSVKAYINSDLWPTRLCWPKENQFFVSLFHFFQIIIITF